MPVHKEPSTWAILAIVLALGTLVVLMSLGVVWILDIRTSPTVVDHYADHDKPAYSVTIMCLNCGSAHRLNVTKGKKVPEQLLYDCPICNASSRMKPLHRVTDKNK